MNEEELMNDIWKNTHHFMLQLANGEKLDLIETRVYKELLKKYVESEKARLKCLNKIKTLGKFDGEKCTRSFKLWTADFNELVKMLDVDKGE